MAMRVQQKGKNHCGTYGTLPERQEAIRTDRKSTRLNSSHLKLSRMPSSA